LSLINKFLEKRSGNNPKAEMGFVDHIEELRWHIVRSLIAIVLGAILVYVNIEWVFQNIILGPTRTEFVAYRWFCDLGKLMHIDALCMNAVHVKFQNTELSGQFMMGFSVSFMIGFIIAFPYVFWEFWKFVKPALKEKELKYAKGIVFWSSLLFFFGVVFSYFIVAPFAISFFSDYQLSPQFENIITISNYYDTMSDLVLGMGIVFELPIVVFFLSRVGILTPAVMRDKRRFAVVIILVLAAVITPPDWFSIFLVAIPLLLLYEAGIVISARVIKEKKSKEETLDW
jgi:sec-independent protein translocase protein TatC